MELTRISLDREHFHLQSDMYEYCEKYFGPGSWNHCIEGNRWSIQSMFGHTHFHFVDPQDAMLFTLKWK